MENEPSNKRGFGWPFWLLVAVVLFLGASILVPNLLPARSTRSQNPCLANLKQIRGAVQQWALENKKLTTDTYSLLDANLLFYLKGSILPFCPAGGEYWQGTNVSDSPRCSVGGPGHSL